MKINYLRRGMTLLFGLILLMTAYSCSDAAGNSPEKKEKITVAFYNVENLFDTEDDPLTNDADFLPEGSYKWTEENYAVKLENLSKVIEHLGDENGPEILGLAEIENERVIQDLINTDRLKGLNYGIVHRNSPDQRGIDVALIYKKDYFEVTNVETFTVDFPENPDIKTRDILKVTGKVKGKELLTVYVNHWSSRRGGQDDSEFKRLRCANVVRSSLDVVLGENGDANVVIVGDFNDESTDKSILGTLDAKTNPGEGLLYNPMPAWRAETNRGSLMYRREWNLFDLAMLSQGILDSKGRISYVDGSAAIYSPDWMQTPSGDWKGAPLRSHLRRQFKDNGFSDHFPVYIHLNAR